MTTSQQIGDVADALPTEITTHLKHATKMPIKFAVCTRDVQKECIPTYNTY